MKGARNILIVEDEIAIVEAIRPYLEAEGFAAEHAADGEAALSLALSHAFDLVLLDLNLPKLSGMEFFRRLRESSATPVIMVTTRGEEIDRVVGLELGADDYVAKPFSPRELLARVKSVLRRTETSRGAQTTNVQRIGDLEIDRAAYEVRKEGCKIALTRTEFRVLDALAQHPGQVLTRSQLLDKAFDMGEEIFDRTLDRHIANLRRKIGDDPAHPRFIETVTGVGYKLMN